jgi:hypothetical protein
MRRCEAAGLVLVGLLFLAGCTPGPDAAAPSWPAIFDRAQNAADALPADVDAEVDAATTRYAGEDSAGDKYWVGVKTNSTVACIIYVPADLGDNLVFCSGPGMTATTDAGKVIEFASSPHELSPEDAELVGNSLLVKESSQ